MAINFPDSPTNGQSATLGGNTWTYNSTSGAWARASSAGGSSITTYDSTTDLPLSGVSAGDQAFVTGSNRMYVSNGTGWYSVSLVNTNPSITSVQDSDGGTTPFTLATDGTGTVITVTASDPEDVPLTYNYSVTSGSLTNGGGTTATVVQGTDSDVNKFTITPSTTEAYAGTFELTFTASDGINQGTSANSFTLQFITIIANSKYTTLLATATDTSDNNNITDASTNNYSITVNGDAHAGTFSPYRSGGYSTYFDGTGDYLSISSNASLNFDYGAFTIEFWVQSSVKTNFQTVAAKYNSSDTTGFFILLNSSGNLLFGTNPSSYITSSGTDICDGAWHHISCTRSVSSGVGTMTIYIDGSSAGTLNRLDNLNNTVDFEIGRQNAVNRPLTGYVSDLRVVKGTAITPPSGGPTERLEAVTNTSLLTCHLPYISDGSSNDHSITVNGDPEIKPFSPYDYNEYSATDHGGSVYFVGGADFVSQYLSLSGPSMPSGDFTLSTWAYLTHTVAGDKTLIDFNGNSDGFRIIYANGTNGYHFRFYTAGGTVYLYDQSIAHPTNQWYYIVVVRDSGTFKLYVNNRLIGTSTATPTFSSSTNVRIGQMISGFGTLEGYLSDIRYNPTTAITDFTPPTAPLSSSGASLHIKGTDASIIDKSQSSNLKLVGNTTGSTTQVKFAGSKSMYFDGSGDYIDLGSATNFNFGTNSFTIEAWVRFTNLNRQSIINCYDGTDNSFDLQYRNYNNVNHISWSGQSAHWATTPSDEISSGTWYHIAAVRDYSAGTIKIYIDGNQKASASDTRNYSTSQNLIIGAQSNSLNAANMYGHIQDFRITKGLARYTANFTPPTASLEG